MPDINGIPYVESTDLVSAYPAASQALAQEISDQLASKLPYAYGTATPSTTTSGFLWYDSNSTPAATKYWDGSAFVPFGGKILQVVSAASSSTFSTSSGTYVDLTGVTVSITPSNTTSKVLIFLNTPDVTTNTNASSVFIRLVRDSTALHIPSILGFTNSGYNGNQNIIFMDSPSTTSAKTYKAQVQTNSGATGTWNRTSIIVMEVSA